MRPSRRLGRAALAADLRRFRDQFAAHFTQTEQLRFLLHYLGSRRLTPAARKRICQLRLYRVRRKSERKGDKPACLPEPKLFLARSHP
jgi:hypothetical protein